MNKSIVEVMNTNTVSIDKNASLKDVTDIITSEGYSHVPVLEGDCLVGVVSKTDLVLRFMDMLNQSSGKTFSNMLMKHVGVESVMHPDPITLKPSDDIKYASELLLQGYFHGLVVTDQEKHVVGMVTAFDLLKAQADQN